MDDTNEIVVQSNYLIEASFRLEATEQKVIFALCQSINRNDEDFKNYIFKISEFMDLLGIKDPNKYMEIPKLCKKLQKNVLEIRKGNSILTTAWLSSSEYIKGSGEVHLCFDPKLKPYLIQLKRDFTQLNASNFYQLKSKYSQRLYQILKRYAPLKKIVLDVSEIRNMLGILDTEYKLFSNLKRKVIEVAERELKNSTEIYFEFEEIKGIRKKIDKIKFIIYVKNQQVLPDGIEQQQSVVNNELEEIKNLFKTLYKGALFDNALKKAVDKKGVSYVKNCLTTFGSYLVQENINPEKNIDTIGGVFLKFLEKSKTIKEKIKLSHQNFDEREYTDDEMERHYVDVIKD